MTFAPPDPATDNTRLVTRSLSYVVGAGGGPPQMLKADVRVPQVEELLGTDAPATIRYVGGYLKSGFDAETGAFAEVVRSDLSVYAPDDPSVRTTLGVSFASDQAGGFATPNLGVSTLTRRLGPLAGTVEQAQANTFDPASFFKGVTARLFGSFDLVDLLPVGSLDQNAPKMRTELQDGGATLVVTLDWKPTFLEPTGRLDLGPAEIEKDRGGISELLIHGVITKRTGLGGGPPAGGGTSDFTGTLNDFRVGILKSVYLNFDAFRFRARSGQKTDVQVALDPANPLEFDNDLRFVEEIRKIIPPGLFGDGASVDVTAGGIRAGFSIGLPPVTVGVFSLKDVTLGAALTLPFADGKPVFDFNVSERARPFLLAVSFFGGGGFFHLQLDTAGIRQLEASLEFGAVLALDIGVATGEVHAMAGIYFSMQRKETGHRPRRHAHRLPPPRGLAERARHRQGVRRVHAQLHLRRRPGQGVRPGHAHRPSLRVRHRQVGRADRRARVRRAERGPLLRRPHHHPRGLERVRPGLRLTRPPMAIEQTVLFTVLPRGISVDRDPMPVSVFVSPRLTGADTLGAFPDWLAWTRRLAEAETTLTIRCEGQTVEAPIDRGVLRPELWEALFHEDTLVRSFEPDDYGDRGVFSYSMRQTLSALKAVYQDAGVHLALPDTGGDRREESRNRARLRGLVDGLDVHWSADRAKAWRGALRDRNRSVRAALAQQPLDGPLDAEGLYETEPQESAFRQIAVPFAVFHHMPTPVRKDHPLALDADTVLDFHQALGALASYPALLRALGLVFDLELPRDAVPERSFGQCGTLAVAETSVEWQVPTATPPLETAYVHTDLGEQRYFFAAPRLFCEPGTTVPAPVLGLLALDPERFGLAQVDVDGGMHKAILLSETLNDPDPDRNRVAGVQPEPAPHPEVFDPEATLPALRSGGVSLFADRRGLHLLDEVQRSAAFNDAVARGDAPGRLYAEDLVRGYRLDVWDARTDRWHSLHRRSGTYRIGDETFETEDEEGFVQLAMTTPAPGATPADDDLYLHEAIARWAGWSLSVPRPGKHLSRYADPERAVPPDGDDPDFREDEPVTPFDIQTTYRLVPGTLPRLAFGRRYRLRARAVDLAGNGLQLGEDFADRLSAAFALPQDPEGFAYLRYEPVEPPLVILRDEDGVRGPGSSLDRLVIRTFNDGIGRDTKAADTEAADRHVVPPRTSVEMGERLGMFDDAAGTLQGDAATWALLKERDAGAFTHVEVEFAGKTDTYPIEAGDRIDTLPHLPDPLSRGAAFRDLPGTPSGTVGRVAPGAGAPEAVAYDALRDPNPRPGSATLVGFGGGEDWQETMGFRLALAEPKPGQADLGPRWDPEDRVLTVYLPKGQTAVVPLSSYLTPGDLGLMGVWQWVRQYVERIARDRPGAAALPAGRGRGRDRARTPARRRGRPLDAYPAAAPHARARRAAAARAPRLHAPERGARRGQRRRELRSRRRPSPTARTPPSWPRSRRGAAPARPTRS